eukprot:76813_1
MASPKHFGSGIKKSKLCLTIASPDVFESNFYRIIMKKKKHRRALSWNTILKIESNNDDQQIESTTLSHLSQTEHSTPRIHPADIIDHHAKPNPNLFPSTFKSSNIPFSQPITSQHPSLNNMQSLNTMNNTSNTIINSIDSSADIIRDYNHTINYNKHIAISSNITDYNQKIHCLDYHKDTVLCVAKCQLLNNNKELIEYIFSGSQDSSIGVWNTDTFQLEGTLLGHSRSILNLYVINDSIFNPLLLSTSRDNCICIWDIKHLSLLFRITGLPSLVYDIEVLSFVNNGGYYLYGCCQDTNIFTLSLSILPYLMKLQYEKLKIEYKHKQQMIKFKKQTKSKLKLNKKSQNKKSKQLSDNNNNSDDQITNDFDLNILNELLLLNKPSILSPANFKQPWLDINDNDNDNDNNNNTLQTEGQEFKNKPSILSPSKIINAEI